jgi:hypothetical protein
MVSPEISGYIHIPVVTPGKSKNFHDSGVTVTKSRKEKKQKKKR